MLILGLALLMLAMMTGQAHAEPVTIALFGAAFAATLPGLVVTAAINIGASLALSGIAYALSGSGARQTGAQRAQAAVQVPERSGLIERRLVYGKQTLSGGVFFQDTVADASSSAPDVYVLGLAVSDGVCDGLESILINGSVCEIDGSGNPITAPWFDGSLSYLKVSFRSGADDQAIDPIIAARFPSESAEFRQRGICTCVIEMKFGNDAEHHTELWGAGGLPDVKFRIRGRKVYDPRDAAQDADDASTWTWTSNATLIEADWLRHEMGFGIPAADIDWDSIIESADIDDELILTLDGFEARGTINGAVLSSEANDAVLNDMALSNRAIIRKAFGLYTIRSDRPATPVATVHQGMLVGEFSFQNEADTRSALNTVNLQFAPAVNGNQPGEIQYRDAALVSADGQDYEATLGLRYTDSPSTAQRLAYALVTENRESRTFTGLFDISVLNAAGKPSGQMLEVGDVVQLWFDDDYDAINGIYTVSGLEISQDFTVILSLTGYTSQVIDGWSTLLEQPYQEAITNLRFTDSDTSSADSASYSFTSLEFEAVASNRQMIAQIVGSTGAATPSDTIPSAVTIGGVAATKLEDRSATVGGFSFGVSLWAAAVPTGETGTVAVTFPASNRRCAVATYALYRSGFTPTASGDDAVTGTSDLSTATTTEVRGIYAVAGQDYNTNRSISLTGDGVARVVNDSMEGGTRLAGALLNRDATVSASSANDAGQLAVWASWD